MSVEIELVDGPMDGELRVIEGDPWDPPRDVVFHRMGRIGFSTPGDEPVGVTPVVYVREVSARDWGAALWLYRYSPEP